MLLLADTLALPLLCEHRSNLRRDRLRAVPPFAPWSLPLLLIGIGAGTLLLGRVTPAVGRAALAAVVLAFVAFQCVRPGRGAPPKETGGAGAAAVAARSRSKARQVKAELANNGPKCAELQVLRAPIGNDSGLSRRRIEPLAMRAARMPRKLLATHSLELARNLSIPHAPGKTYSNSIGCSCGSWRMVSGRGRPRSS